MFPLLNHSVFVVCRCCLVEQPEQCHSIGDNDQLLSQLLTLSPTLQIVPSDVICQLCLHRLHDALDFRQRCEESERILRARNEQALDDALECLEREVGCLEKAKSMSMSMSSPMSTSMSTSMSMPMSVSSLPEPVDFGSLDLSDLFRDNQEQLNTTISTWDAATLNTPIHLPGHLEPLKPAQEEERESEEAKEEQNCKAELVVPPKRKRAPRKAAATAGDSAKGERSRTPKSLCPCTECEKKFTRNFQLKLHMISVHGLGDGLRYKCEVCAKSFASRHSLRYHFTSLHSTERPFVCELCDRRFVLRTQLISHARMHTGETKPRIFDCTVCGKTWPTKSDLRTHMRSHDPDMSKRPYKCDKCNKAFFTRGHLNSHHLVHTGEKPYACPYCDKSYQSVGNLNNHTLRQHSNLMESQMNLKYVDLES